MPERMKRPDLCSTAILDRGFRSKSLKGQEYHPLVLVPVAREALLMRNTVHELCQEKVQTALGAIPHLHWCESAERQEVAPQSVSKSHVQENIHLTRFNETTSRVLKRSKRMKHRNTDSRRRGRATAAETAEKNMFNYGA